MRSEARAALLFLAPAIVLLTVFFFAPVLAGLALSLTDFDLYTIGDSSNLRFVGARNYRDLFTSASTQS
jgi:multiple sugar transport system permease protein